MMSNIEKLILTLRFLASKDKLYLFQPISNFVRNNELYTPYP